MEARLRDRADVIAGATEEEAGNQQQQCRPDEVDHSASTIRRSVAVHGVAVFSATNGVSEATFPFAWVAQSDSGFFSITSL